ncbi:MAG: hypothetical protein KJ063_17585 [Anaerolineae bacterium]|nr:hypothetical protein [Anaerolineae bacterium]
MPNPRRALSTNDWLAAGLVILLLIIGLALFIQAMSNRANGPNYSRRSGNPLGARGFYLWLEKLDYTLNDSRLTEYAIPAGVDMVIMLEPAGVSDEVYQIVNQWVRQGGTLLLAGEGDGTRTLARQLALGVTTSSALPPLVWAETPLVASPTQDEWAAMRPQAYFRPTRRDYLPLYTTLNYPIIITYRLGQGRIIASSTAYPFTNQGLAEQGNAAAVLNLLTLTEPGSIVWFDEWHHGDRRVSSANLFSGGAQGGMEADRTGPLNWLRYHPVGQAFLYGGMVIFVALLLSGRAFGRPLTLAEHRVRRPPLAYVQAIANLNRRAGHRADVLHSYHQRLKKMLGHRYRLSPALPDEQFVQALGKYDPGLDAAALHHLLTRLQNRQASEAELVQLATEVATWLKQ